MRSGALPPLLAAAAAACLVPFGAAQSHQHVRIDIEPVHGTSNYVNGTVRTPGCVQVGPVRGDDGQIGCDSKQCCPDPYGAPLPAANGSCLGSWELLRPGGDGATDPNGKAIYFACSLPGCELLQGLQSTGTVTQWDPTVPFQTPNLAGPHEIDLANGVYVVTMRLYNCHWSPEGWTSLRRWAAFNEVQAECRRKYNGAVCGSTGCRPRSEQCIQDHRADAFMGITTTYYVAGLASKRSYFPNITVLSEGDGGGGKYTERVAKGAWTWENANDKIDGLEIRVDFPTQNDNRFSIPFTFNISDHLPQECTQDDYQCWGVSAHQCDKLIWKDCGNPLFDGKTCVRENATCPDSKSHSGDDSGVQGSCRHQTAQICPNRCGPGCKPQLQKWDDIDGAGCRECTSGEISLFENTQVACAGDPASWDSSCDAGYCGGGPCPPGSFCPKGFQCKMSCRAAAHSDDSYYCPVADPLGGTRCSMDGQIEEIPAGHTLCPGSKVKKGCPDGMACSPDAATEQPCPESYYCTKGHTPEKCFFWASCPQGTSKTTAPVVVGVMFLGALLVVVWLCTLAGRVRHKYLTGRQDREHEEQRAATQDLLRRQSAELSDGGASLRRTFSGLGAAMVAEVTSSVASGLSLLSGDSARPTTRNPIADSDDEAVEGSGPWNRVSQSISTPRNLVNRFRRRNSEEELQIWQVSKHYDPFDEGGGISAPTESPAPSGDAIALQPQLPHTGVPDRPKRSPIAISFTDLSLTLKPPLPRKCVLTGVTGELKNGRLTAIMGPSGAGKTSFLNVVSGKASAYGRINGDLKINGIHEKEGISAFRRAVGFVPQEDTMMREMTPKEILKFSARLRLPPNTTNSEIQANVVSTLDKLNLWKIRHSQVGDEENRGISGGQRKRVNIGMELVANPSVLFLDEPTSGLDSTSSLEVCQALRDLADDGINVAAVLHQPRYEIFKMFHDVLLLGTGGVTVYLGPAGQALRYFEHLGYTSPDRTNPADFLMDVISGSGYGVPDEKSAEEHAQNLRRKWDQNRGEWGGGDEHMLRTSQSAQEIVRSLSTDEQNDLNDPRKRKMISWRYQTYLFFLRAMQQHIRPMSKLLVDYSLITLMGLLIGVVFKNADLTKLAATNNFTSMAVGFTTIQSSLRLFGAERVVFWREVSAGASRSAYFIGKNLADLPRLFFIPAMYLSLFQGFSGVHHNSNKRYLAILAAVFATSGIGYLASIFFNPKSAQLVRLTVCLLVKSQHPATGQYTKLTRNVSVDRAECS
jgi:ABC-type multidrug transport system ATPase subunit